MLKFITIFTIVGLLAINPMAQTKEREKEDILGGRQLVEVQSRDKAILVVGASRGEKLEYVADPGSDTLWNRVVEGKLEPASEAKWAADLGDDLGVKQCSLHRSVKTIPKVERENLRTGMGSYVFKFSAAYNKNYLSRCKTDDNQDIVWVDCGGDADCVKWTEW